MFQLVAARDDQSTDPVPVALPVMPAYKDTRSVTSTVAGISTHTAWRAANGAAIGEVGIALPWDKASASKAVKSAVLPRPIGREPAGTLA